MRVPRSFLEGFIFVLLAIPIVLFLLLKWVVMGLVYIIIGLKGGNNRDV